MNTSMAVVVVFLAALVGVAHPALLRPTPVASTPRAALSMMASPVRTDVPLEGSAKELPSTKTTGSYQLTGDKLYTKKEIPPALGGIRLGFRKLAVVTGASSGLGLWTAKALADKGDYFVICAVRDPKKMDAKAKEVGISSNDYCAMKLELGSFQSVKDFVFNLKAFKSERPLTHLVCNAAVYRPADPEPAWTDDGYEMSVGVNHLGHFLLLQLLLPDLERAKGARCVVVGSITGNSNTIGGGFVYPRAEIGELKGLKKGGGRSSEMVDGGKFDGAKAYKDAKALNMMTVTELHRRYHDKSGVVFSSMYPGCIAETGLFREKRQWFRDVFPLFMKYVTGGYVSEQEAGERLAQVIWDERCSKSGVYWSWNGNAQQVGFAKSAGLDEAGKMKWEVQGAGGAGGDLFENEFSGMIKDERRAKLVWDYSLDAVRDFL
jgi:protochlorophyllide reductase